MYAAKKNTVSSIIKLLSFIICILLSQKGYTQNINPWADSCTSNSFFGKIINPGYSDFFRVHNYPGNDLVTVGTIKDNFAQLSIERNYGNVMRFTASGNLQWSRFIGFTDLSLQVDARVYTSIVTSNGDIVIVEQVSASAQTGIYVVRLSGNGNMLWQKKLPVVSTLFNSDIFIDMIETSDAGFLITGVATVDGILMKLSSNGDFQWHTRISSADLQLNIDAVAEGSAAFYIAGKAGNLAATATDNFIAQINRTTGDVQWVKWIYFSAAGPLNGFSEYEFENMSFRNGVLNLTGTTSSNYVGPNRFRQATISLDESGNFISGYSMENSQIEMNPSYVFLGSMYDPYTKTGAQFRFSDSSDYYVFRLNPDNSTKWAWRIAVPDIQGGLDSKVMNDSSFVVAGLSRDVTNQVYATMLKTTSSGRLEGCSNQPYQVFTQSITASVQDIPNMYETNNSTAQTTNGTLEILNGAGFSWQLECSNTATCRMSKIAGPKNVCKDSANLFAVTSNGNCNNPISFSGTGAPVIIYNADGSATIKYPTEGSFVLYATMQAECKILKDSLIINVKRSGISFSLGPDTSLCPGNKISIKVPGNYTSYTWQDGSTDSTYIVSATGLYYVTVKDPCGKIFSDSIQVDAAPPFQFDIGPGRIKCNSDTLHISAPAGFYNYSWSPDYNINSTHNQQLIINPLTDTAYFLVAEKYPGCLAFDTLKVQVKHSPAIELGTDKAVCLNDTLILNAGSGFDNYKWNDGKTTQFNSITKQGTYIVVAIANACQSSDTIRISYDLCLDDIYIPTAFTPNDDGTNDEFRPRATLPLLQYHFEIFDRWGRRLFETHDINKGWDGKFKNQDAAMNTFAWICTYQFEGRTRNLKKGKVLLIK